MRDQSGYDIDNLVSMKADCKTQMLSIPDNFCPWRIVIFYDSSFYTYSFARMVHRKVTVTNSFEPKGPSGSPQAIGYIASQVQTT